MNTSDWSSSPPDSPGFWWLYGDEEFGTMGGNYNGSIPPDEIENWQMWKDRGDSKADQLLTEAKK